MSCFGNEPYSGEKKKQTDKDKTELISSIILNLLLYNTACILKWSDLSQGLFPRKFWQLRGLYSKILI